MRKVKVDRLRLGLVVGFGAGLLGLGWLLFSEKQSSHLALESDQPQARVQDPKPSRPGATLPPILDARIQQKLKSLNTTMDAMGVNTPQELAQKMLTYAHGVFELYDTVTSKEQRGELFRNALTDPKLHQLIQNLLQNPVEQRSLFANDDDFAKARVFALDAIIHEAHYHGDRGLLEVYLSRISSDLRCQPGVKGRHQDFSDLIAAYITLRREEFLQDPKTVASSLPCHAQSFPFLLSGIMGGLTQPEFKSQIVEDFYIQAHENQCQIFKPDNSKECS